MNSAGKHTGWLVVAVLALGVLGMAGPLREAARVPASMSIVTDPIDAGAITRGLRETRTAGQSLRWLHGAWVGENEFFRPVPSFLWYGCYRVWGEGGVRGFLLFLYGWHLGFLVAAFFALRALFGRTVALLTVALFSFHVMFFLGLASPYFALLAWKEVVEMEWGTFFLLSLWMFLRFVRGGGRGNYVGALALGLLACLSKEAAYTLPLALLLLLWRERKWEAWLWTLPFWAGVAGLVVYRTWLFGGRGAHYGSNGSWPSRTALALVGGRPLESLIGQDWRVLTVFLLAGAVAVWLLGPGTSLSWRRVRVPLAMAAVGIAAILVMARGLGTDAWTAGAMLLLPDGVEAWAGAGVLALVLLLWASLLSRPHRRDKAFAYGMLFLTYLPAMTAQVTAHVEYVPALWWGALMAFAARDGAAWVRGRLGPQRPHPSPLLPKGEGAGLGKAHSYESVPVINPLLSEGEGGEGRAG